MNWKKLLLVLVVCFITFSYVDEAFARPKLFKRGRIGSGSATGSHMDYIPSEESTAKIYNGMSLEDVAQLRANAMAAVEIMTHDIHSYAECPSWEGLGVGEGIGRSTCENPKDCSTCIVGSRVVADAHARGRSGMVYRVRFFR